MGSGLDDGSAALGAEPWRHLASNVSWTGLVLPDELLEQLRELPGLYRSGSARASDVGTVGRSRYPLCLLFGGSNGVGRTSAALALAGELELPVLKADARKLISGDDAPELVDRLLTAAAHIGAVLVLDNADATLEPMQANGARGRVITPETLRLLRLDGQEVSGPEIVIFCVSLVRDAAEVSGLHFDATCLFPEPDAAAREQIWARCLPAGHRVPASDLAQLARVFRLVGASIARCCEQAERTASDDGAPVSLRHIAQALEDEYRTRLISDRTRAGLADLRRRAPKAEAERAERAQTSPRPVAAESPVGRTALSTGAPRPPISPHHSVLTPASVNPSAPGRSRRARLVTAAIIVLGALAAAALGLAASSGDSPSTAAPLRLDRQATIGPARFAYPSSWRTQNAATVSGQPLSPGITLVSPRPNSGQLVIGVTHAATQPIPAQFMTPALASAGAPKLVTLGARRFYRVLSLQQAHESLYVSAATGERAVAACQTASATFARDCERVLSTLVLTAVPAASSPDPAYAQKLTRVLNTLNQARTKISRQLALARTGPEQARAAANMTAAHLSAATSVSHLNAGSAASVNRRLLAALDRTARAYGTLATAATAANTSAYATAQQGVRAANASLTATLAQLRTLGYAVS
jgi:hypothetical protein